MKLDCRSTDGRRTVLTRSRFLFFHPQHARLLSLGEGTEPMQRKALTLHTVLGSPLPESTVALSLHSADYVQSPYD